MISVSAQDFESWRATARQLIAAQVAPDELHWGSSAPSLFERANVLPTNERPIVPKEFLQLAEVVSLHRDERRWGVLYRVLYRLTRGGRDLLRIDVDEDVRDLQLMEKSVRRDMHKMKAFVRFRPLEKAEPDRFVAWYKPDHYIVKAVSPWFAARFGNMRWSILTPDLSVHWDLQQLTYGAAVPRSDTPAADSLEGLWKDYYGSIFNPARVKIKAMTAEMPVRHWATLPETEIIPNMLAEADSRIIQMASNQKNSAVPWVPATHELGKLRAAAPACRGCDLYEHATQIVFGEGPPSARIVMVGEQPGNEEDLTGHPFVGPAGQLLDKAMREAELDREAIYVTNAVKHFKFKIERGKRRIHVKPGGIEVSACRPWLEAELNIIHPDLVVCLGATAAQTLMGRDFRITANRGKFYPHRWAKELVATIHPSAILRATPELYDEEYQLFVRDLRLVAERIKQMEKAS